MVDSNYRAMVGSLVELVLMRWGPQYHAVIAKLEHRYNCKIIYCFDHPEYLRAVLRETYNKDYEAIVGAIEAEFGEAVEQTEIANFVYKLKEG
jgi:homoserine trans-succinylase